MANLKTTVVHGDLTVVGDTYLHGAVSSTSNFSDFAEMLPNRNNEILPVGTMLTLDDGCVRRAMKGEFICGVVSHTAVIVANDTPHYWQGRYEVDELGAIIRNSSGELIESPCYDPTMENIPRSKRPLEWSCVGMLGQVYVRTGMTVSPNDRLEGIGGVGFVAQRPTGVRVMKVTKPFDGDYGVAKCLINIQV